MLTLNIIYIIVFVKGSVRLRLWNLFLEALFDFHIMTAREEALNSGQSRRGLADFLHSNQKVICNSETPRFSPLISKYVRSGDGLNEVPRAFILATILLLVCE